MHSALLYAACTSSKEHKVGKIEKSTQNLKNAANVIWGVCSLMYNDCVPSDASCSEPPADDFVATLRLFWPDACEALEESGLLFMPMSADSAL
jgi:hypothetical protein